MTGYLNLTFAENEQQLLKIIAKNRCLRCIHNQLYRVIVQYYLKYVLENYKNRIGHTIHNVFIE